MRARRAIRAGEVVERYEERAATLVTRTQARRAWTGHRRRWFEQYAWPLTDETHVMWSADPEEWRPVNHSCDPTTWLEGLDVVARRDIAEGEELTMDYATFCGPEMEQFECYCGAPECRHVITASDYLLPEVHERYRGHVSDYVERHLPRSGERPSPAFFAKRNQYGVALASRRVFRTGEVVCGFDWGKMHGEPTVHSIQAGEGRHAEPRPFLLRYINHSCEPNVVFDIEEMVVRAVREVRPGDELTFFYPSTEWRMTQPFQCGCGTEQCVGWVTGAADLAPEVLARYDLTGVVARRTGLRPRLVGRAASVA
jgi:D-alanine-D-alanine ligase